MGVADDDVIEQRDFEELRAVGGEDGGKKLTNLTDNSLFLRFPPYLLPRKRGEMAPPRGIEPRFED